MIVLNTLALHNFFLISTSIIGLRAKDNLSLQNNQMGKKIILSVWIKRSVAIILSIYQNYLVDTT